MTTEQLPQAAPSTRSRLGVAIIFAALAVAALAAVVGGVVFDNALHGRIRDRTGWGILLMALGASGPVVAVLVVARRRRILRQATQRRWGELALFPGSFVAACALTFVAYGTLTDRSTAPVIPYTPKLVVRFHPGEGVGFNTEGDFGGSWQLGGESYSDGRRVGDTRIEYWVVPDAASEHPVAFAGVVKHPGGNRVELHGALELKQKVRMRVEGLEGGTLLFDGQPRDWPLDLEPGRYQVVIAGDARE